MKNVQFPIDLWIINGRSPSFSIALLQIFSWSGVHCQRPFPSRFKFVNENLVTGVKALWGSNGYFWLFAEIINCSESITAVFWYYLRRSYSTNRNLFLCRVRRGNLWQKGAIYHSSFIRLWLRVITTVTLSCLRYISQGFYSPLN